MACIDLGAFNGLKNKYWKEFLRRFRRKYVGHDETVTEIPGGDRSRGGAKSIVQVLPYAVKRRGFNAVTSELGRLLADDSTGRKIRALTELRNLHMRSRPGKV
ncbi:hypothetical protein ANCDUO_11280 [Ancylostoma duodenale]|uniref:Uncharacterized protein n=1 Tax=Ancylostoma duodenale TaxID=51022 RepID=A0A0C2CP65_9BILA|nr:hypothetical protein ANCDUO_11280 [Ancylostoma duodenale]